MSSSPSMSNAPSRMFSSSPILSNGVLSDDAYLKIESILLISSCFTSPWSACWNTMSSAFDFSVACCSGCAGFYSGWAVVSAGFLLSCACFFSFSAASSGS